jgi:hypothetical protein
VSVSTWFLHAATVLGGLTLVAALPALLVYLWAGPSSRRRDVAAMQWAERALAMTSQLEEIRSLPET